MRTPGGHRWLQVLATVLAVCWPAVAASAAPQAPPAGDAPAQDAKDDAAGAPEGPNAQEQEEEKYYRRDDPEDPAESKPTPPAPAPPPEPPRPVDLWSHTFTSSVRFFQGIEGDAGLKSDGLAVGINLQYMWSPLARTAPVRFEIGAEMGWIDQHGYESGGHTPQAFLEIRADLEPTFQQVSNYPANTVGVDTEVIYGGPVMRLDFLGPSSFDLGISTAFLGAQVASESYWFCTDCNGTGPSNETTDESAGTVILRFGAFFSWQYDWFAIGVDAGATYFQKNKLPMRYGFDFGFRLSVGF
jgi:hypothetical protein